MGALQDSFVQKANSTDQNGAADLLNGMSMPDMLAAIAALGAIGPAVCNNLAGILRLRGWIDSAQRIDWAGQVVQRREIPNPPPGLAPDQVDAGRRFLGRSKANGKYTDSTQEAPITTTVVNAKSVIAAIKVEWPALSDLGARTLASQFMYETGGGKECYNWNLGGLKAAETEPHFYMKTFECWPPSVAKAEMAGGGRGATPNEATKYRCKESGTVMVWYDPPHRMTRFRNSPSLNIAARAWVGNHKRRAGTYSEYVTVLDAGDIPGVIRILKLPKPYFTGGAEDYEKGMAIHRAIIDRTAN